MILIATAAVGVAPLVAALRNHPGSSIIPNRLVIRFRRHAESASPLRGWTASHTWICGAPASRQWAPNPSFRVRREDRAAHRPDEF